MRWRNSIPAIHVWSVESPMDGEKVDFKYRILKRQKELVSQFDSPPTQPANLFVLILCFANQFFLIMTRVPLFVSWKTLTRFFSKMEARNLQTERREDFSWLPTPSQPLITLRIFYADQNQYVILWYPSPIRNEFYVEKSFEYTFFFRARGAETWYTKGTIRMEIFL